MALFAGTPNKTKVHRNIMVGDAECYDVLIGFHFINRVTNVLGIRDVYWEVMLD